MHSCGNHIQVTAGFLVSTPAAGLSYSQAADLSTAGSFVMTVNPDVNGTVSIAAVFSGVVHSEGLSA
ncbi:hypothetical protein BN3661_01837 [Eubacteriaceae bacterium CHKCI005]|nr:hypothetical protein BN3661_01837 [Eubacteriaceae bacterium CHKCI005]